MKEYIEKPALLENLNHAGILSGFVKFKIERFPAADVAEVRHGRWIFEPGKIPYCSECKKYSDDGDKGATFCPWCGARMGEEDEHEAD
mgnify:CR=1 FL=1